MRFKRQGSVYVPDRVLLSGRRSAGRGGRARFTSSRSSGVAVSGGGASVTLASVSPTTGVVGTTITFTGTGFAAGQAVLIGPPGNMVTMDNVVYTSSTSIDADVPSAVSGLVSVSVAGVTLADAAVVAVWDGKAAIEAGSVGAVVSTTPNAAGYAWGAADNSTSAGRTAAKPAISTAQQHSATKSLAFSFGPNAEGFFSRSEQRFTFGASNYLNEFWLEYWLYVPSNYTHRFNGGANNNKFLVVLWRDAYGWHNNNLVDLETWVSTPGGTADKLHYIAATPADNAQDYFVANPVVGAAGPLRIAAWNRVRCYWKEASGDGVADGRLLVTGYNATDGEQTILDLTTNLYPDDLTNHGLNNGYFQGEANSGYLDETIFYLDDARLYTANPGW